jgi:hypothetical protein
MKTKPTSPLLEYTATSFYASLQKATEAMCKHKSKNGNTGLTFSIFETPPNNPGAESGDWIVNHPDIWSNEPVFENQVTLFSDYWRISEEPKYSDIMNFPTWSDIICEANRQLIDDSDGSTACLFLEGFHELEPDSCGVRFFELMWGS